MLLTKSEIRQSVASIKAAFPRFTNWEHHNELDEFYCGFAVWGEFTPAPHEMMPTRFFVTFDTFETSWRGHLTVGQHCYFWSSASDGDAHLLDTRPCGTLEEAIATLKNEIKNLLTALLGS